MQAPSLNPYSTTVGGSNGQERRQEEKAKASPVPMLGRISSDELTAAVDGNLSNHSD